MKAYPLINTRLKYQDFVGNFFIRPDSIDYITAKKYIKQASDTLNYNDAIIQCMFAVKDFIILGVICSSENLAKEVNKVNELRNYLYDEKGRTWPSFIGISIPNSEISRNEIPNITLDYYLDLYIKTIKDKWEETIPLKDEILSEPLLEIQSKIYEKTWSPNIEKINGINTIIDSDFQTEFDYFCYKIFCNDKESFISNYCYKKSDDDWTKLIYKNVAIINQESLDKLKIKYSSNPSFDASERENEAKTKSEDNNNSLNRIQNEDKHSDIRKATPYEKVVFPEDDSSQKKTSFPIFLVIVIALIVILLIVGISQMRVWMIITAVVGLIILFLNRQKN